MSVWFVKPRIGVSGQASATSSASTREMSQMTRSGGSALSLGVSYANLPLVGAAIVVMALAVALASVLIERNGREPIAEPSTIG